MQTASSAEKRRSLFPYRGAESTAGAGRNGSFSVGSGLCASDRRMMNFQRCAGVLRTPPLSLGDALFYSDTLGNSTVRKTTGDAEKHSGFFPLKSGLCASDRRMMNFWRCAGVMRTPRERMLLPHKHMPRYIRSLFPYRGVTWRGRSGQRGMKRLPSVCRAGYTCLN